MVIQSLYISSYEALAHVCADSEECFSPRENQSTGREDKKGAQGKGAQVPALAPITDLEEDDTQSCNSIAQALAAGEMR
eukprot:scaffold63014_cov24-Tisochrysis_lutea.AAC.1